MARPLRIELAGGLCHVTRDVIDQVEKLYIQMMLKDTWGRIGKAAKPAGIHLMMSTLKINGGNFHRIVTTSWYRLKSS